jgi:hypothetical protein
MPRKVFTAGEVLAAADVNNFLMDQTVMTFAGTAARSSAIGTATEGMVTWLNDENALQVYDGSQWNGLAASSGNAIINGAFDIWQRGTSFAMSTGVVTYTADRMRSVMPTGATISRQTFTPGTAPVAGYEGQFYFNALLTTNAQNYEHGQFIENARTFAGQTVTLSFWARSTVGAQPMSVAMFQNFGTGGSPSSLVSISPTSGTNPYTPTGSWVRYIYTFNVPSVSGKTFGTNNDSYLWVRFGQYTATATNTSLDYWGLQLEAGRTANVFRRNANSLQGELAACQRYYCKTFPLTVAPASNAGQAGSILCPRASNTGVTAYAAWWQFPVPMRVTPTSITTFNPQAAGSGFFDEAAGSVAATAGNQSNNAVSIYNTGAAVVGRNAVIHAVAEAEL